MMLRLIFLCVVSLHLCSCILTIDEQTSKEAVTTNELTATDLSTAESIMVHSHDYQGLAEFYKSNLKKSDTIEMRLKLAKNYLVMHDADSAVFYLKPLTESTPPVMDTEVYFVLAKAYYELGETSKSIFYAQKSVEIKPENGEALNLLGIVYSAELNIEKSRQYFNKAREFYFDDIKIKNNLAMLNIIEGKYNTALVQLASLYKLKPDDDVIKTNFLLVLAKKNNYEAFYNLLKYELSDQEIAQLYMTFKQLEVKELKNFVNKPVNEISTQGVITNETK